MGYWSEVVQETTTFTLPNPDEYERPEEIREIEVNRVKARSMAVEGDALNFGDKLRASLLGQLNEAMSDWEDRDLRRSFVHMQVGIRVCVCVCVYVYVYAYTQRVGFVGVSRVPVGASCLVAFLRLTRCLISVPIISRSHSISDATDARSLPAVS